MKIIIVILLAAILITLLEWWVVVGLILASLIAVLISISFFMYLANILNKFTSTTTINDKQDSKIENIKNRKSSLKPSIKKHRDLGYNTTELETELE